ncbi:MAG: sigma-54 dependent transcriptional regulator [Bacteroidaceae bacterium]|nr:sigma-54 dependent transcriptional regulator [Bacteroidaceae bacterium]
MAKQGTILIVDDNRSILTAVRMLLENTFKEILTLNNPNQIPTTLHTKKVDVVLLDMNFSSGINSGNEGLFWLREIKKIRPDMQVVLFTAYADIDLAVSGIKEGATDFIVKPWNNAKMIDTLQAAYRQGPHSSGKKEKKKETEEEDTCQMFWGKSYEMQQLRTMIEKVSCTDANILITGENGTGKELLANEIHRLSPRHKKGPMVPVDMGAITETLFESELFGHVKGAFTDAQTDRAGKFEIAENGTLFLDEIGNLSYHLQAKLLTVLQRRSIVRVGSNTPIPINIRLICATNRNLEEMVNKELFREDLLYRINTIQVKLPALRQRSEDIVPLADIFLSKYADLYNKPHFTLQPDAQEKLKTQPWYGNIRELEHVIEKTVIMGESRLINADDIDCRPQSKQEKPLNEVTTLEEMEYQLIKNTIEKQNGNLSMVASQLGISRQTLYNKIKRYGL